MMMNTTAPGWYPVNESRELGYFDGTNWTGERVPNPDAPQRTKSPWAVIGFAVVLVLALIGYAGFEVWLKMMAG